MGKVVGASHPRWVVNFAAESHVDRSIDNPYPFIHTNVTGTLVLLDTVRRMLKQADADQQQYFRFLHVSTDEVYGTLGADGLFTEETAYRPNSPYSASKAASDHLVRAWGETFGLPVLVTNCSNNYGPYHLPEKLIPNMRVDIKPEEVIEKYRKLYPNLSPSDLLFKITNTSLCCGLTL